ncbi:MAG: DUF2911 domain-containing protein [Vicinamibacteria bacterium]|nr:DUF2911 domain-containing protein [Vicinamibacteria bacterium]
MKKLTVLALTLAAATSALAQMPARGKAEAQVGGKAVSIDYGQAKLGARSLDELMKGLSPDRIWRAGRDQVTTITTAGPITIGGKAIPAGKYSLYVPVGLDGTYSLAVNKDLGVALKTIFAAAPPALADEPWPVMEDYDKNIGKDEVARVVLTPGKNAGVVDPFAITLTPKGKGATLTLAWGDKSFSAEVMPGK